MSKFSPIIALGTALVILAGCGARVSMTELATIQGSEVDLVIVESKGGTVLDVTEYGDAMAAAQQLEHLVLAELAKRGISAAGRDSATGQKSFGAAGTALLALSVAKAEKGSTAKRLLVGFGGVRSADALLLPEPYLHLSAHTALHSSLAHGHSNIMVVRRDGTAVFKSEDVWVSLRIAPPELRLGA